MDSAEQPCELDPALREPDEYQPPAIKATAVERTPPEPMARIRISMADPISHMRRYMEQYFSCHQGREMLDGTSDLSQEDLEHLFDMILLSMLGAFTDRPAKVMRDTVEHMGLPYDYFESRNAEIALAMMDGVARELRRHFPIEHKKANSLHASAELADKLEVYDAFLHGRDHVIIVMPLRILKELQHAAPQNHSPIVNTGTPPDRPGADEAVPGKPAPERDR